MQKWLICTPSQYSSCIWSHTIGMRLCKHHTYNLWSYACAYLHSFACVYAFDCVCIVCIHEHTGGENIKYGQNMSIFWKQVFTLAFSTWQYFLFCFYACINLFTSTLLQLRFWFLWILFEISRCVMCILHVIGFMIWNIH